MELLDTNSIREDFPFFSSSSSSSLSDNNPSKHQPDQLICNSNGFNIPLFQNSHCHFNHQNCGSDLNFQCLGGSSSIPDHFGVLTPSADPFEAYANGFSKDFGAYGSSSPPSVPLASDGQNGLFMHGFYQAQSTVAKNQIYPPLSFREFGSATNAKLMMTNELSCITAAAADQTRFHKRAGKKKRMLIIRKASKVQKKSNIIKGQWTPQEDRSK